MTKKFYSTIIAFAMFVGIFGIIHYANAADESLGTTTSVGNASPIITVTPGDTGSHSGTGTGTTDGNPNDTGDAVTFTVTAHDVNSDQYYLAVCGSESVTAGADAAPTCADADNTWVISGATNSDAAVSGVTYTVGSNTNGESACTSDETCAWHAFVCDKVATGAACFPGTSASDQGYALGTVTFSDVPVDQAVLAIDGRNYEFDLTNGSTCATTPDVCLDASSAEDGAEAAAVLQAGYVSGDDGSAAYVRGAVVYIYATTEGVGGNDITMSESGDTGEDIALSGANLTGGDTENASPFYVNHKPTIVSYGYGDTAGAAGLNHASGTVEPGDTLYVSVQVTDADVVAAQDTVSIFVCDTDSFTDGASPACGGTQLCTASGVDPTAEYAECSFTSYTTVPTANDTYTIYVFVVDNHGFKATESATRTFDVEDVPPVLTTYTTADTLSISAGGSDTMSYSVSLYDDNGDNDVDDLQMVFFDDNAVNDDCSADENDCYIENIAGNCAFTGKSSPGSGKTALGTDKDLGADCDFTVYFNSNASTDWEVQVDAQDGIGWEAFAASIAENNVIAALQGVDVVAASIAYGTVEIGGTSARQETSMGNVGNQVLDMFISGDTMCTDYPTCSGSSISLVQQKFNQTDIDFDWDDPETNPGPWILDDTGSGTDETTGCINRDIAVRNDHSATTTNESIWWKIRIPASQAAGSYTGQNTFTTTASTTCSGGTPN